MYNLLRQNFFFLSMCFSLNKTVFHFGSVFRRPNTHINLMLSWVHSLNCLMKVIVKYLFVSSFENIRNSALSSFGVSHCIFVTFFQ